MLFLNSERHEIIGRNVDNAAKMLYFYRKFCGALCIYTKKIIGQTSFGITK